MSDLKADVSVLKTDVSILKTDVSILKTDVSDLKTDVARIDKKVDCLELRMENEAFDKIGILFDAWQSNNAKMDAVLDQVDHVAADTGLLVRRVTRLEQIK